MRFCFAVFLVARISLSLLGLGVGVLTAYPPALTPGTGAPATSGIHNLWDGTSRLDAAWFILIAEKGYDATQHSAAFFPAYPLAIRVVGTLPGVGSLAAALLVSNLSFLGALILLYLLTTRERTEADARRAVVLLTAFPTSFFFLAPYAESSFLLLTLLAFSQARSERWSRGGAAGAVAAASRSIGIVLLPALLTEAWQRARERGRWDRVAVLGALAVALGPLAYVAWWYVHSGSPFAPVEAQAHWQRTLAFPLVSLGRGLGLGVRAIAWRDGGYWISDAVLTVLAIAGVVTAWRRTRAGYLVYAVASLLVPLCYPYPGRDLVSISRFVIVIFPAFWGFASWARRRWAYALILAASIPLYAWHALLFMHWREIY